MIFSSVVGSCSGVIVVMTFGASCSARIGFVRSIKSSRIFSFILGNRLLPFLSGGRLFFLLLQVWRGQF